MNGNDPILTADFRAYVRLLLRHEEGLTRGEEDSPEIESLLAEMDVVWDRLTTEQRRSAAGLSSDLNGVRRGPAPRAKRKEEVTQDDLKESALAFRDGRWHDLLASLRRSAAAIPPAVVAYVRGRAWLQFGEPALARVFFQRAVELEPRNANYAYLELESLNLADPAGGLDRAIAVLSTEGEQLPARIIKACEIRMASLQSLPVDKARPVLDDLASILDRTMTRLRREGDDVAHPSLYAVAAGLAGDCRERLGELDAARRYYDAGLAAAPDNDSLLVTRGILQHAGEI